MSDPECKLCGGTGGKAVKMQWQHCACALQRMKEGWIVERGFPAKGCLAGLERERALTLTRQIKRTENMMVSGPWPTVGRAMGLVASSVWEPQRTALFTDAQFRSIYMPDGGKRSEHVTFLSQVGDPGLLVLRLGFYAMDNKLIAGAIYEALRERERQSKITWITTEPHLPWDKTHPAFSKLLNEYLNSIGNYRFFDTAVSLEDV